MEFLNGALNPVVTIALCALFAWRIVRREDGGSNGGAK
ncbi:hypothetical protein SAMN05421543_102154 [Alicyclobacillus macrosporangiidus]|uniref:Uncharacterized protein n=1 Tax=Alicyclobacillus macrosporangiidus TaxID=392015 RepID=A0A1I7GDR3_9BACL|nr:hypothetical protein SAMN05421543_102154 [Alicyclobacillus macrosporangiidus]